MLSERLKDSGFTVVNDGLRGLWNPDEQAIDNCRKFGKEFTTII